MEKEEKYFEGEREGKGRRCKKGRQQEINANRLIKRRGRL